MCMLSSIGCRLGTCTVGGLGKGENWRSATCTVCISEDAIRKRCRSPKVNRIAVHGHVYVCPYCSPITMSLEATTRNKKCIHVAFFFAQIYPGTALIILEQLYIHMYVEVQVYRRLLHSVHSLATNNNLGHTQ